MIIGKNTNLCVLVPVYNNDIYIGSVIEDIQIYTNDIIVVNDGSTDNTKDIIGRYNINILTHEKNRGKGVALTTGFKEALNLGYTHALVMDGDAQHLANEIPGFIEKIKTNPNSLIIGTRKLSTVRKVPFLNRIGNSFSNWWVRKQTGYTLEDTQCGQRVYPLESITKIITHATRYDFELELLVNAAWNGIELIPQPIQVKYNLPYGRITHYNYFYDTVLMALMNTKLLLMKIFNVKNKKSKK